MRRQSAASAGCLRKTRPAQGLDRRLADQRGDLPTSAFQVADRVRSQRPKEVVDFAHLAVFAGWLLPLEAMAHRLATPEGKKLYARRKHTPESVFGIVKSVLGFRQFLLRGLDKVRGEWSLVTMAWKLKRLFALNTR
jgi:hypothetical protein